MCMGKQFFILLRNSSFFEQINSLNQKLIFPVNVFHKVTQIKDALNRVFIK